MVTPIAVRSPAPLVAAWEVICASRDRATGLSPTLLVKWAWKCLPLAAVCNTAWDICINSLLLGELRNMSTFCPRSQSSEIACSSCQIGCLHFNAQKESLKISGSFRTVNKTIVFSAIQGPVCRVFPDRWNIQTLATSLLDTSLSMDTSFKPCLRCSAETGQMIIAIGSGIFRAFCCMSALLQRTQSVTCQSTQIVWSKLIGRQRQQNWRVDVAPPPFSYCLHSHQTSDKQSNSGSVDK